MRTFFRKVILRHADEPLFKYPGNPGTHLLNLPPLAIFGNADRKVAKLTNGRSLELMILSCIEKHKGFSSARGPVRCVIEIRFMYIHSHDPCVTRVGIKFIIRI